MKKINKEELHAVANKVRKLSPQGARASELIKEFIESGDDIVEIEPSDFDGIFDFDDIQQKTHAYRCIHNRLKVKGHEGVIVVWRSGRIFLRKINA